MTARIVSIQFASFVYAYGKSVISAWALELSVSTVSGNAKASESGTGNRQFPRSFLCSVSVLFSFFRWGPGVHCLKLL